MSSSHDLVQLAKGNVRVSVEDLSQKQQLEVFDVYAHALHNHYNQLKGGSLFVPWAIENFGDVLTTHNVRRYSLVLDKSLYPKDDDYNSKTRIIALISDYFKFPDFKKPKDGIWKLGDSKLVTRICLVQDGELYLEWYEGKVTEMYKNHENLPNKVLVTSAEYIKLPFMMCNDGDKVPEKFKKLIEIDPGVIYSFGYSTLNLLGSEIAARQERVDRDRRLFDELNKFGRIFKITGRL